METAFDLVAAANFLVLPDLVAAAAARVAVAITPADAIPWLHAAQAAGLFGASTHVVTTHALASLLDALVTPTPALLGAPVVAAARAGVLNCTARELAALRLNGLTVRPEEPSAALWAVDAPAPLQSPRSKHRLPVTFINLRPTAVDVIWVDFDGAERRYTRGQDNVDSAVQSGAVTSWSSVKGHMWRLYEPTGLNSRTWLGGVTVGTRLAVLEGAEGELLGPLPEPVGAMARIVDTAEPPFGHQYFVIC